MGPTRTVLEAGALYGTKGAVEQVAPAVSEAVTGAAKESGLARRMQERVDTDLTTTAS
jgi:hypothetical protein